jgi:hypothetical protein
LLQFFSEATESREGTGEGIVHSAPLLEAFGNSKTVRNDNSSRFGKWMEIKFQAQKDSKNSTDYSARIVSTRVVSYLLEKSRVVSQSKNERNYHCFYQLCAACMRDQVLRKRYYLDHPRNYKFLNQSDCYKVANLSDEAEFDATVQNLVTVNFSAQEIDSIWKVLAAILHLGNIHISPKDSGAAGEVADILDDDSLVLAADLLSVHIDALKSALITREIGIGSLQRIPLDVKDSNSGRDSLAKALYQSLFSWVVDKINSFLAAGEKTSEFKEELSSIGVLDIFGFEIFEHNSFEQFCINYANEKLQLYFTDHILQKEQEDYKKEGVSFEFVNYQDNRDCTEMIDGKLGAFQLLEEECMVPKGADAGLITKMNKQFAQHRCFGVVKKSPLLFEIRHYAGDVSYDITGFVQKNRDTLQHNLSECVTSTSNLVMKEMFSFLPSEGTDSSFDSPKVGTLRSSEVFSMSGEIGRGRKSGRVAGPQSNKLGLTKQFRLQLTTLMSKLEAADPFFIRCLKPNQEKKQDMFEAKCVLTQMKQTGLFEAVKIRASGFAFRMSLVDFVHQFSSCFPLDVKRSILAMNPRDSCSYILQNISKKNDLSGIVVGKTKVFMQASHRVLLYQLKEEALYTQIVKIQKVVRRFLARRRYKELKKVLRKLDDVLSSGSYAEIEEILLYIDDMPMGTLVPTSMIEKLNSRKKLLRQEQILTESLSKAISTRDLGELEKLIEDFKKHKYLDSSKNAALKAMLKEGEKLAGDLRNEEDLKKKERDQKIGALNRMKVNTKKPLPPIPPNASSKPIPSKEEEPSPAHSKNLKQKFANVMAKGRQSLARDNSKSDLSSPSSTLPTPQTSSSLVSDDYSDEKDYKPSSGSSSPEAISLEATPSNPSIFPQDDDQFRNVKTDDRRISVLAGFLAEAIKMKNDPHGAHARLNFRQAAKSIDGMNEVRKERDRLVTRSKQLQEELRIIQGLILECDCILEEGNLQRLPESVRLSVALPSMGLPDPIPENPDGDTPETNVVFSPPAVVSAPKAESKLETKEVKPEAKKALPQLALPKVSHDPLSRTIAEPVKLAVPKSSTSPSTAPPSSSAPSNAFSFMAFPRASAWHAEALGSTSSPSEEKKTHSDNQYVAVRYYFERFLTLKDKYKLAELECLRDPLSFSKHALFNKKRHQETMYSYSNAIIPTSMIHFSNSSFGNAPNALKRKKDLVKKAQGCFKDILNYMNIVYHSYGYASGSAFSVVQMAVTDELLRDEVFVQLIKQTTDNPDEISKTLGFKLMFMCLCAFPPTSIHIRLVLESHLAKHAAVLVNKFVGLDSVEDAAAHCWEALDAWQNVPASKRIIEPLNMDQITAITVRMLFISSQANSQLLVS